MYSNSRFNLRELQRLDPSARLNRLTQLVDKNKDSESWREIAQHVLRNQDRSNQYNILKNILSRMKNGDRHIFKKISQSIDSMFECCHTMGAVFVLAKYLLSIGDQASNYFVQNGYRTGIRKFGLFENQIKNMEGITHIDNDNTIFAEIESAVQVTPKIYSKLKLTFQLKILKSFLSWLVIYRARNYDYCAILDQFCKFLVVSCANANKLAAGYDIEGIGTLIISLLDKCLMNYPNCHNMCLILQHISDLQLQSAVLSFENEFIKFSAADLIKFSNVLTRSSIGPKTIKLLLVISSVLKNSGMQQKLLNYFREFIVKRIFSWGKISTAAQTEIQQLSSFFVDGLLGNIQNKQQCIDNIQVDFSKIQRKHQQFWIKTMYKIAYQNQNLCSKIAKSTNTSNTITPQEYEKLKNISWKISSSSTLPTSQSPISQKSNLIPKQPEKAQLPSRSIFQDSPISQKRSVDVPIPTSDKIPQSAQKPLQSRPSYSMILPKKLGQSSLVTTPQQSRYLIPPSSSATDDGFLTRSPVQTTRKTSENDARLHKTATKATFQSGSSMMARMQPPMKRTKQQKVTSSKVSLIPPKSAGYNTNYVQMSIMLLFGLEKFPLLLDDVKDQIIENQQKYKIINELHTMFQRLANFEGKTINLKNFMKLGPSDYDGKDQQFQICQYITKLFTIIFSEIQRIPARYNITQKFKQLFEIIIKSETTCPNCEAAYVQFQNKYFLTFPNNQALKTQWTLNKTFTCQKCSSSLESAFVNKIISSPVLTMVQLIAQNKVRQPLSRVWNNSKLVGIVIGNTSSKGIGQYRFYYRNLKNPLTWIQFTFNYGQALQFVLQQQNEQFEAKFVPCLAVYQQE